MRSLLSSLMLVLLAGPAVAVPVNPVPEPGTLGLMLAGLAAAGLVSRRRRK